MDVVKTLDEHIMLVKSHSALKTRVIHYTGIHVTSSANWPHLEGVQAALSQESAVS